MKEEQLYSHSPCSEYSVFEEPRKTVLENGEQISIKDFQVTTLIRISHSQFSQALHLLTSIIH